MIRNSIKDQTAIVGVGWTPITRNSGVTVTHLAAEATMAAVRDSGLSLSDIDGLIEYQSNDSVRTLDLADVLGIDSVNWYQDISGGGDWAVGAIASAAMAIASGACDVCLVYRALNGRTGHRFGSHKSSKVSIRDQWTLPYGYMVPSQWIAMWCRTHMAKYGTSHNDLGQIAVNQRYNASMNERAIFQNPLTMEDYLSSRWINEPFHIFDCTVEVDGACAVIVTSASRAATLKQRPVMIEGFASGSFGRPSWEHWEDMTVTYAKWIGDQLWKRTGLRPDNVDFAELYDCFTYSVLAAIEDYGFCEKGQGGPFVASGATKLDGQIPINTHGGLLSEGYIHGLNHTCEAVSQLRGQAGRRQVQSAERGLVTGGACPMGGAIIYHI